MNTVVSTIPPLDMAEILGTSSEGWSPCDYGKSSKRESDPQIRACNYISHKWSDKVPNLGEYLTANGLDQYDIREEEILRYDIGDHFEMHVDRHRGPGHMGTLLLVVPSPDLVGGQLKISGIKEPLPSSSNELVYIPLGTYHSVSDVSCGHRYALKAALFHRNPKGLVTVQSEYQMDPITRIIVSTGLRLPTEEELEEMQRHQPAYRKRFARKNAIDHALGLPTLCD